LEREFNTKRENKKFKDWEMITIDLLIDLLKLDDKRDYKTLRAKINEEIKNESEKLYILLNILKEKRSKEDIEKYKELEIEYNRITRLIDNYFESCLKDLNNEIRLNKVIDSIRSDIEEYEMSLE
jgi:hypothetical protein